MPDVQIIGRSTSHFTRVVRIFASELGVPCELVQLLDLGSQDLAHYGGNPALKIPSLRIESSLVFGAENCCRALAKRATASPRIVWPEDVRDETARNAYELVRHGMDAQVQLVAWPMLGKVTADNIYLGKIRAGFEGTLRWLDDNLASATSQLPPRDLSLFEVMLFCLVEHLEFRATIPLEDCPRLTAFARDFDRRISARDTGYRLASQLARKEIT